MEDLHEDMEDFIIASLADLVAELGEGSLGGDMIRIDARIGGSPSLGLCAGQQGET